MWRLWADIHSGFKSKYLYTDFQASGRRSVFRAEENSRAAQTTMIIVDSKSIQNADTAESKGYDAGKKLPE